MTNDDVEAFIYKVDGDGPDYACENYPNLLDGDLRVKADAVAAACKALTSALEAEAERRGFTVPW
jgi:hypothetical protein